MPVNAGRLEAPALVSIVGAGPGDPELLTWRAVRRLEQADIVFYDGLVPQTVVDVASTAQRVTVSRRPGSSRIAPAAVADLMIAAARRGQRVVRLRAGDPFVLARGAEEALALVEAGIPFEIVPGLTTASVAATVAGIPLTHRSVASAFVVVSGHDQAAYRPILDALPANALTVVVLMGLGQGAAIARAMLNSGWRSDTPVATIISASRPDQSVWTGTLEGLGVAPPLPRPGAAGVIVIGDVVRLGERIRPAVIDEEGHERRDRHRSRLEHDGAGGRSYGSHERSDGIRSGATFLCKRS